MLEPEADRRAEEDGRMEITNQIYIWVMRVDMFVDSCIGFIQRNWTYALIGFLLGFIMIRFVMESAED